MIREGRKARREVETSVKHAEYEPGTIPVEWEAWIRGKRTEPPSQDELKRKIKQSEVLKKRVQQVEERERELRTKEFEEGLVAKPPQEAPRPVGHASAPFYENIGDTQGPTSTGSSFQPGGWDPNVPKTPESSAEGSEQSEAEPRAEPTFQPEAWVPPGGTKQ